MADKSLKMPSDSSIAGQKNKLLVYFAQMQKLNEKHYSQFRQMALDSFAQSKFAGDETSGNIYSSAMEGIKIYQQSNIAQTELRAPFDGVIGLRQVSVGPFTSSASAGLAFPT